MSLPEELEPLDELLEEIGPLAARFEASGHRLYLVGGVLRDLQSIGTAQLDDLDFTTDAAPDETLAALVGLASAVWRQGERFGTIGARVGDRDVEITTHRAEVYDPSSRKPDVEYSADVEVDLSRRDFTINAIAFDLARREVIDPFGGRADLVARVLRTPLDPHVSFADDPLRMVRAARFAASLDLSVDPALLDAIVELRSRIAIVSAERLRDEVVKLLRLRDPGLGLSMLWSTGLIHEVIPELADHDVDALIRVVRATAPEPLIRLAALTVPLGPAGARRTATRLRLSARQVGDIESSVALAATLCESDDVATLRRAVARVRTDVLATGSALALCWRRDESRSARRALLRLIASEGDDTAALAVSGGELIAELDLEPGPEVGRLVRVLQDRRLEEGPMTRRAALEAARRAHATRAREP